MPHVVAQCMTFNKQPPTIASKAGQAATKLHSYQSLDDFLAATEKSSTLGNFTSMAAKQQEETASSAYVNIAAGACLAIALRFAGTRYEPAYQV
jgi:hypothetical protein